MEPTIPDDIEDIEFSEAKPRLTCIDQPMPSVPKMKPFKSFDPSDPRSYLPTTRSAADIDVLGNRVNAYAKMDMLAATASKLIKMVPMLDK